MYTIIYANISSVRGVPGARTLLIYIKKLIDYMISASNAVIISFCKHISSDDSDNFRGCLGDNRDISFTASSEDATDDDDEDDDDDDDDDGGRGGCMFFK